MSGKLPTVSFHNFKSQNFKSSVSNPKSKYVVYMSALSRISNCQGLGRKNKFENLKTYRMDMGVPPLNINNLLESDPLKSRFSLCGSTILDPNFLIAAPSLGSASKRGHWARARRSSEKSKRHPRSQFRSRVLTNLRLAGGPWRSSTRR